MSRPVTLRRSLAATAALVAASWGTAALPAQAVDSHAGTAGQTHAHAGTAGQTHAHNGQGSEQQSGAGVTKKDDKKGGDKKGGGKKGTTSNHGHHNGGGTDGGKGDPGGNNGTVKIAPLGEMDGIPNNSPHPGCTFQVEWYGYDEGADIISQVSFAMQAPTKDVALSVDGPSSVFVGGDPATGAGTDTGQDGVETYTLSFDGEPQAQQGYHVKLTVATPRSHGNDTKTKVFWVEPCETSATPSADTQTSGTGASQDTTTAGTTTGETTKTHGSDIEVMGVQASATPGTAVEAAPAQASGTRVPTSIDAGEHGNRTFADWVSSPLPLAGIAFGLALVAFAFRRRLVTGRE